MIEVQREGGYKMWRKDCIARTILIITIVVAFVVIVYSSLRIHFSRTHRPIYPVRIPKIRPTVPGEHVYGQNLPTLVHICQQLAQLPKAAVRQLQSVRTNLRKTHHYRTDHHGTGFSIEHLIVDSVAVFEVGADFEY